MKAMTMRRVMIWPSKTSKMNLFSDGDEVSEFRDLFLDSRVEVAASARVAADSGVWVDL